MNEVNECGKHQRLSPSEVAEIEREARRILWWDMNFPIAYRYYRKFKEWIGVQL